MRDKCYQREMAEREMIADAAINGAARARDTGPIDYDVMPIEAKEAAAFIRRYEWLGNVGHPLARYCARDWTGEVAAVALFGKPHVQSAGLCRKLNPRALTDDDRAYMATVACLERGATAHWAHQHTASWFIPRALEMASRDHGWKIFYAYSDADAGEVGTVYQACGWQYLGIAPGRGLRAGKPQSRWQFRNASTGGKWISDRSFYERTGLGIADARAGVDGWETRDCPGKGKYVQFVGDRRERRDLLRALRYPVQPYPKWDLE